MTLNDLQRLRTVTGDSYPISQKKKLKKFLLSPTIFDYPDFSESNNFVFQTDALRLGLGAVLSNSNDKVVAYASRNLRPAERRQPLIDMLFIVWAVRHFRAYLNAKKF